MAEKLRIAIVEDEQTAARDLENCLNSYARERGFSCAVEYFCNGKLFLEPGTLHGR